jgi:cell surface protein SprA
VEEFLEAQAQEQKNARLYRRLADTSSAFSVQPFMDSLRAKLSIGVAGETFYRMFGGNEISVRPQGVAEISFGIISNKTDNFSIPKEKRRQNDFDFNFKSNLNILGEVGTKFNVWVNYNTEATFDYQNDIKIEYTGKKDEIIQKIELGNIGMKSPSQFIRGVENLFGAKIITQWGPLTSTALLSIQKSENKSITIKNGGAYQQKRLLATDYEQDRFFYLSLYFRERYDSDIQLLPNLPPGTSLIKIEIWTTNTTQKIENSRNKLHVIKIIHMSKKR